MIAHMQLQLTIDTPATNETVPTKTLTSVKKKKKLFQETIHVITIFSFE